MSRLDRPVSVNENPNPSTKFLHWKSNDQNFEWYNKETKEKIKVKLPLKVLFLEHYHTVKGWSDSSNSGIWSNEVFSSMNEEMEVKNSNGVIVKGIYSEHKVLINNAGGSYHRSIYCMTEQGEIINLQLKGSAVGGINADKSEDGKDVLGWNTFYGGSKKKNIKGVSHLLDNQWIEINLAKKGKSGSVTYSIPFFEVGAILTKKENDLANKSASILQEYMNEYFSVEKVKVDKVEQEEESEDMPF